MLYMLKKYLINVKFITKIGIYSIMNSSTGSSKLSSDTDSGTVSPKTVRFAEEDHVVGKVEERYEGFYERYDESDGNQATMASIFLMSQVSGDIVDPFQIMYGGDSGPTIIKKHLTEAYVDQDAGVVIELGKPITAEFRTVTPAKVQNYDAVLKKARKELRDDLWKDLEALANDLNGKE